MKPFILLFFATTLLCQGQIINFPDPNFKNALLNNPWIIDTNGDGEIQISEAEAFSNWVYVSSQNISDLTGIEYFINITKIEADHNSLTQVDLSTNINLEYIYLESNILTSLDFSNNIKLKALTLGNNQIHSINLSNNVDLEFLSIADNFLTELNLVNNSKLYQLYCVNNQLTTINLPISNSSLNLLYCSNNQLTTIDLTNQISLRHIGASNNQLINLDLTSQTELIGLGVNNNALINMKLSSLINLEELACANNYLTTLDVSNSPNLKSLWCNYNLLTTLEINNDNLYRIDCSNNFISSLTINSDYYPEYPNWQRLNCSANLLTELDLSNTNISQLNCSNNPELQYINFRTGWSFLFDEGSYSGFQNLPNLTTVCLDSAYNQELIDFILAEAGHSVFFYNNETCDALSVDENNLGELIITPNPAENSIKIETNIQINQIEIYNELGQLVLSNTLTISTSQTDLDISALGQGLYFVKIANEDGNATIKKVIKK